MATFVGKDGTGKDVHLVEEDGMRYPLGITKQMESGSFKNQLEMVRDLDIRDDDVLIVAYVKSGTHWLWEIVRMIQNKRVDYDKLPKENSMLDFRSKEHIGSLTSPRVLNMHFPVRWLPRQLLEKRRPILHIMRNPKDVFVSYFNHYNTLPPYDHVDSFSAFLPMMTGENGFYLKIPWYEYELEWEKFSKENPDYPILHLYYEDLKKDPKKSITQIAQFLKIDISEEMIEVIADKTDIKGLRRAHAEKEDMGIKHFKVDGQPLMYRKGITGDWKNWFTVAQNEKMDKWLEKHLVNTDLKFQFS